MKLPDNLKAIIAAVAPTLATALGGPLVGAAATILARTLGTTKADGTPDEKATAAILATASPDTLLKVKQAEFDLQKHMADLGVSLETLAVDDRKSARALQLASRSFLVPSLAVMIVLAFIIMVGSTLLGYSHVEGALAGTLVGYLSAKCEQVVGFYFGSSAGSARKDELLAKQP